MSVDLKKPKKVKVFNSRSFIIGQLRRTFRRYPPYYETLNEGKEVYYIPSKTGKQLRRVKFPCAICNNKFKQKEVSVDHIESVIPLTGFPVLPDGRDDWNTYIPRLFCPKSNLQRICHTCHNKKSGKETKIRKINRKEKKKVDVS